MVKVQTKFSKYVRNEWIVYKHAKGTGADPTKEFHDYHEILLFVGGKTTFISEEKHTPLSPFQIVVIPKKTYHQFTNIKDEEYHRCVFSFYDIPEFEELIEKCMYKTRVIEVGSEQKRLFNKMNEIVDSNCSEKEKHVLMHALLALVLNEVAHEHTTVKEGSELSETTSKSIEIINANLCNKISVPELSKMLNVSVSTLTQAFKRDMNISIYRYVLTKKLILAQQKIKDGEPATAAAMQCGFNDYSGFYKQYKKMFGVTPSEKATGFIIR
jgi:AraC-like DNA-binding protein/mannose-6-phosphate isomerase-like protein (cupin superfamily)